MPSFLMSDGSESLRSLTKNELCEQIVQVANQKWANGSFAHLFAKHEWFAQKTNERIPSPAFLKLFLHNINLNVKKKNHVSSLPSPLYIWNLMYFISVQFV